MRILIRTDIGGKHGMGHATRMRALAHALVAHGAEVGFVTGTPALQKFVFPFRASVHTAAAQVLIEAALWDVFVIDIAEQVNDGYRFAFPGLPIVRIDFPEATPDMCSLLVLPNLHTSPAVLTTLRASFGDCLIAGAGYVLLDQEVTTLAPIPYAERINGPIVFCAGGSDPDGALKTMYQWTHNLNIDARLLFCIGSYAEGWYGRGHSIRSFSSDLLRTAALVVTTFGQTVYECLYWHTPVLIVGHTERHCEAAQTLAAHHLGHAASLGDIRTLEQEYFIAALRRLWDSPRGRMGMAQDSVSLLDGKGVERVAERILGLV